MAVLHHQRRFIVHILPLRMLLITTILLISQQRLILFRHANAFSSNAFLITKTTTMATNSKIWQQSRLETRIAKVGKLSAHRTLGRLFVVTPTTTTPKNNDTTEDAAPRRSPPGVMEFDEWFAKLDHPKASVHPAIQHDQFAMSSDAASPLRGLSWNPDYVIYSKNKIATIPGDVVLSSKYTNNENWDRDLALELWNEMIKPNQKSSIWGYCALLGHGDAWKKLNNNHPVPPSAAPHALRHWTNEQRQRLERTSAGRAVLEAHKRQQEQWKQKYLTLPNMIPCSESQFLWAMEVVHSRAFCGIPANPLQDLPYLLAPIVAAGIGYWYATTTMASQNWDDSTTTPVLMILVLGSVALTALSFTKQDSKYAVLLPLIDSANHRDDADSVIEYDPLRKSFELTVGSSSFVEDKASYDELPVDDSHTKLQRQVYISYGDKSDTEWLLNYGFLPGIIPLIHIGEAKEGKGEVFDYDDEYRRQLAEAFLERNG